MKVRQFIILFGLLVCSLSPSSQTALTTRVKTQQYDKSYLIMPVYKCTGTTLEAYTDAYAGEVLEKFEVKLPDLTGCTDTGYAFTYFSGFERNASKNYNVIIIGNAQSYLIPKIYIDRNHNLDFTDDGPYQEFPYNQSSISFDLCNARETTGCLHYTLSRYRLENQYTLRKNLDDFFTFNAGTKKYLGMHNSFRVQCANQWGADVNFGLDSFRLVVEDHNQNGIYNEGGVDHIRLVPYGQEPVSNDVHDGSLVLPKVGDGKPLLLQHLSESYEVTSVAPNGQTANIHYRGKQVRKAEKLIGKRAPRFQFEVLAYRKYNKLRKLKGKPVYLFFYNFQTADTTVFNQLLKLNEANQGKMTIIALDYGDNPTLVKSFVQDSYYMWYNGLATRKIYEKYKVDQLPMGFLLNSRLRVVKIGVTPTDVLKLHWRFMI